VCALDRLAVRTLLVRMGRPDVLVAGDFLLNKWLEEAHGIPNDATNAESERKRIDAAKPWAPWRSVAYLVVARAAGATSAPVLA
jgi:3-methyladenine DNA glycosylase/8-oxoguanine DNA glycosylase